MVVSCAGESDGSHGTFPRWYHPEAVKSVDMVSTVHVGKFLT